MDFYRRVGMVCRQVPKGRVVTYGQIALLCGKPRNSRQVGYALRKNLAGEVPAFRVVNSQGYLSGEGTFARPDTQRKLLRRDGVKVSADGRVDLRVYGWQNTMDEALFLRARFEEEGI